MSSIDIHNNTEPSISESFEHILPYAEKVLKRYLPKSDTTKVKVELGLHGPNPKYLTAYIREEGKPDYVVYSGGVELLSPHRKRDLVNWSTDRVRELSIELLTVNGIPYTLDTFPKIKESLLQLKVKRLHPEAKLPTTANPGDHLDLYSVEDKMIHPNSWVLIDTGIALQFPEGFCGSIRSRSGMSAKHGVERGAGELDVYYRGPVGVVLYNHGLSYYKVNKGDRIAQMVIQKYYPVEVVEVDEVSETERGVSGFGASGK